jgi:PTH1 family peptidyl-tRNA hydrolase
MKPTHLIIGLGNPGPQYQNTRHNVGFVFLDYFLEKELPEKKFQPQSKFKSAVAKVNWQGQSLILAQPQTFMNLSGQAVRAFLDYYQLGPENLLVIHDEKDLPLGKIRLSHNSGPAGHNGIKSIIKHLGTQEFTRLRIGIGDPELLNHTPRLDTSNFVLGKFSASERDKLQTEILPLCLKALQVYLAEGVEAAKNRYN